jgi:hypothetical protein
MSPSPWKPSCTGGVFACDDDVCDAAEMDDAAVDGRPERADAHPSFIESIDAVLPTAPGTAEYAKSACPGLKLYGSTEGSWIMLRTRGSPPEWCSSMGCGDVDGRCCSGDCSYGLGYGLIAWLWRRARRTMPREVWLLLDVE